MFRLNKSNPEIICVFTVCGPSLWSDLHNPTNLSRDLLVVWIFQVKRAQFELNVSARVRFALGPGPVAAAGGPMGLKIRHDFLSAAYWSSSAVTLRCTEMLTETTKKTHTHVDTENRCSLLFKSSYISCQEDDNEGKIKFSITLCSSSLGIIIFIVYPYSFFYRSEWDQLVNRVLWSFVSDTWT